MDIIKSTKMSDKFLGSLLDDARSTDDLQPQYLSGDQNSQKTILLSDISGSKSNFLLSVTTIMKTVIGAGILSLPLTTSRLGYILTIIMFVIIIAIIQFGSVLLLKAKNLSKHSNYSSISYHIFRNKYAQILTSLAIFVNNTGVCIIELTILKAAIGKMFTDYIKDQVTRNSFFLSSYFIVIILALLQLPITFVKKIEKLKFLAFTGVSGITIFIIGLTIQFFIQMSTLKNWMCSSDMVPFGNDILQMGIVIPNMMLALSFQMNFFPIFKGMKDGRDQKMEKASLTGICACAIFYIIVGYMGYCIYGNNVQANFLLSFKFQQTNNILYLVMNIGFIISLFASFPILYFGARNNFISIVKTIVLLCQQNKNEQVRQASSDNIEEISSFLKATNKARAKQKAKYHFIIYTIILFLFIIGVAISVDDIQIVFNAVGSIASNLISFIFPSLFYFMLVNKKKKERKTHYYVSLALFFFFVPFGIFSLITKYVY